MARRLNAFECYAIVQELHAIDARRTPAQREAHRRSCKAISDWLYELARQQDEYMENCVTIRACERSLLSTLKEYLP